MQLWDYRSIQFDFLFQGNLKFTSFLIFSSDRRLLNRRQTQDPREMFTDGGLVTKLCPILATPWEVAHKTPLSMEFPRQEYWSGLLFPFPGDLPNPGFKPVSCIASRFFTEQPDFPFHQPKFICQSPDSQYLRMWLYLEIGSSNQVKRQALIQND